MLHDGVRVRDLDTGGKWKALSEPEMLHRARRGAEDRSRAGGSRRRGAGGGAAAEPEVIKKGKVDKDGEKEDRGGP